MKLLPAGRGRRRPRPPAPAPAAAPAPAGRRLAILLAEDNAVNQKVVTSMLEKRGHAVTVAGDGRQALAALAGRAFDLVLMDVQMPEMDGFEAVAAIRREERVDRVAPADHRPDGPRHEGGPRALPGRRLRRLRPQADPLGGAVRDHRRAARPRPGGAGGRRAPGDPRGGRLRPGDRAWNQPAATRPSSARSWACSSTTARGCSTPSSRRSGRRRPVLAGGPPTRSRGRPATSPRAGVVAAAARLEAAGAAGSCRLAGPDLADLVAALGEFAGLARRPRPLDLAPGAGDRGRLREPACRGD